MNEGLIKIHNACISKNLPFVTFRKPQQEHSTTYIQTTPEYVQWKSIQDISTQTGFIMAPFDSRNGHQYILIKPDLVLPGNGISKEEINLVDGLEPGLNLTGTVTFRL